MRLCVLACAALLGSVSFMAQADDAVQNIRESLTTVQSDLRWSSIEPSPLKGIYQVKMPGGRLLYATPDGKYLINGHLLKVEGDKVTNVTQEEEFRAVAQQINSISTSELVVFPAQQSRAYITVFTDPDCGYCRKLHNDIPELNRLGIEVRYLAYPRMGMSSRAAETLISVWCAEDRQAAMNKAKLGEDVPRATCDNPVKKHYELGGALGVNGTPTVVLGNGQVIPGYQPAEELARLAIQAR